MSLENRASYCKEFAFASAALGAVRTGTAVGGAATRCSASKNEHERFAFRTAALVVTVFMRSIDESKLRTFAPRCQAFSCAIADCFRPALVELAKLAMQESRYENPRLVLPFVFLSVVRLAALAVAQASTYTAAQAANHVGETATVKDRVDGVRQSGKGNFFLNMGGKYPNQAFTAFIRSGLRAHSNSSIVTRSKDLFPGF